MNITLKRIAGLTMAAGLAFGATALAADFTWTLEPTTEITDAGMIGKYYEYHDTLGTSFDSAETRKEGMITADGKVTIPAEYRLIDAIFDNDNLLVFTEDGVAIINSENKVVVEAGKYDFMEKFNKNTLIVRKDSKHGLISPDGKEITGQIFSEVRKLYLDQPEFRQDENYLAVQKDGLWGVIDKTGKTILPIKYQEPISLIADDLFFIGDNYKTNEKYIIDVKGKILVGPEDMAGANPYADNRIRITRKDLSITYINKDGTPFDNHGFDIRYVAGDYYIIVKDDRWGIIDKNFNVTVPCKYYGIFDNHDGTFSVQVDVHGSEKVFIDAHDNLITKYGDYGLFGSNDGYTIVVKDNCYGIMDPSGKLVVPCEYAKVSYIDKGIYALHTRTNKIGFAKLGGDGKKVTDTFEGLILQVGSNDATAFGEAAKTDAAPIIRNGRTMLPARFVAENLGAEVGWDAATKTVIITPKSGFQIKLTIGSTEAWVGPYRAQLDSPAFIEGGRTYTPVRFIAENLGAEVFWDAATKTVKILK